MAANLPTNPAPGDKVVYTGWHTESTGPVLSGRDQVWLRRQTEPSLVVTVDETGRAQMFDPASLVDFWYADAEHLRVVERATYQPAADAPAGDDRSEYTAGLRLLADLLDRHPEVPLPYDGSAAPLVISFLSDNPKAKLAAAARAFPGPLSKDADGTYFDLNGHLRGLLVQFTALRNAVCERVVVGTDTVVKQVPDPAAPMVAVVEEVDRVEWVCSPVLAAAVSEEDGASR